MTTENDVKQLQKYLAWLGLYTGAIDGISGRKTENAMDEFMEFEGYEGDIIKKLETKLHAFVLPDYNSKEELANAVRAVCTSMYATRVEYAAYIMATVEHETAGQFVPLEEADHLTSIPARERVRAALRYKPYWARGLVGITHAYNYLKYSVLLGYDFVATPAAMLRKDVALFVLVHGMLTGGFTGRRMREFILKDTVDVINMRRVVNGVRRGETLPDKAELIASYYAKWMKYYEKLV